MDVELYARRRRWRKAIKELGETKRKTWAVLVEGQLGIMAVTALIPQVQDNWLKCIMIAALAIGLYAVFNLVQSLGQLQGAYEICCKMLKLSDEEVRQQGGKLDVEAE